MFFGPDRDKRFGGIILAFALIVSAAGWLLAQNAPQPPAQGASEPAQAAPAETAPNPAEKIFVVNGREIPGSMVQVGGKYYVSVDALAQITSGTLSLEANRIALAIPALQPGGGSAAPSEPEAMTRDFVRGAVSALAEMREWKAAMATVVQFGVPVVGTWPNDYSNRVQDDLTRARLAATSPSDQNALGLLQNEAGNLSRWSSDVVSSRAALNAARSVDPNALGNDSLFVKIEGCSQFLNGMIGSGIFADDPRCH